VSPPVARGAVGVCGWRCQIGAKDDHGFVRRSGASAWAGRIGAGRWTLPDRSNSPSRSAQFTPAGTADSTGGIITGAAHMIRKLSPAVG